MDNTYLKQQGNNQPLYPDMLWSKPEQKSSAGKLAIIGGSERGFNTVSQAYARVSSAGAGAIRVLFPSALRRTLAKIWPESEFAPSSKSGEFAASALSEWLDLDQWSDSVLLPGDLGKSSETAILLERYLSRSPSIITLSGDSINILIDTPAPILENERVTLAVSTAQLQSLLVSIRYPMSVRLDNTLFQLAGLLHSLTLNYPWCVTTIHQSLIYVSYQGEVSVTPLTTGLSLTDVAAYSAVWRMQQPAKSFMGITSGIYELAAQKSNNSKL